MSYVDDILNGNYYDFIQISPGLFVVNIKRFQLTDLGGMKIGSYNKDLYEGDVFTVIKKVIIESREYVEILCKFGRLWRLGLWSA